ncbi:MAG: ADP-ribosylglycohydrolase family protein [Planctomycetota bacterium]|nr:MAG: ADP-ribosylglycohydrolase family protein [Planctomycetota bacterium]
MIQIRKLIPFTFMVCLLGCAVVPRDKGNFIDLPVEVVEDKIRGGLLGQLLGNLNGLPYEMKFIDEPGNVESYTPSLPQGARTDDDSDIEWVYVLEMQGGRDCFIAPKRISELWRAHINEKIWCANRYARHLMELGLDPPLTGREMLNPWAEFNISGQFLCETFGLVAPAMPQTAARLGLHYTHVAIDGEPAQTTQLFTAMISVAFVESDIEKILDAGLRAVDPKSKIRRIINDVRRWWEQNPDDWRRTRKFIKDKYSRYNGEVRDRNGYELNTASVICALLYGGGDFVETNRLAFNFGWDADCNAATAATIIGVIKGGKWMDGQGWNIVDRYANNRRPGMPTDETITRFGDRLCEVAKRVVIANGGEEIGVEGVRVYRIVLQRPRNVERLMLPEDRLPELKKQLMPLVEKGLTGDDRERACSAYLAICLDEVEHFRNQKPQAWNRALEILKLRYRKIVNHVFKAHGPVAERLQAKATAVGLKPPEKNR